MFAQLVPFGCPRLMARPRFPGGAPVRFRLSSVERKKSGAGPLPRCILKVTWNHLNELAGLYSGLWH
jgi:hypothetical protein